MRASAVSAEQRRGYTPPPELSRSAPRDLRLTRRGRVLMVLAWLIASAALPCGALLYRVARQESDAAAAFDQRAVSTIAVVDRLWRKKGDGNPAFAALHFDAGGTRIAGEVRMRRSAWQELQVGAALPIRYLPDDPRQWRIAGARPRGMPFWVAYLIPVALIAVSLACAAEVRRQRVLLAEGRVAPARITSLKKHHGAHGAAHNEIAYEFPLLGGGTATGRASATKSSAVGGTICVVYDPDRPGRNRPYPFSLVAPDSGER
jgi:hypothetical protein